MKLIPIIIFVCVHALLPTRVVPKLNTLKIKQIDLPVQESTWEDGEVPWLFRKNYTDGNETGVRLTKLPPFSPLSTQNVAFLLIE